MNIDLQIKKAVECENATVKMKAGDYLTVEYADQNGKLHSFHLAAQPDVFIVMHEGTDAAFGLNSGGEIHFQPGTK